MLVFESINSVIQDLNITQFYLYLPRIFIYAISIQILRILVTKKVDDSDFIIFIALFLCNFSTSTGGYIALFYIPIIPILYSKKYYEILILILLSFFIGFWDYIPLISAGNFGYESYLSGKFNTIYVDITLGNLIRPVSNFFAFIIFYKKMRIKYANQYI